MPFILSPFHLSLPSLLLLFTIVKAQTDSLNRIENLGASINTVNLELNPKVTADGKQLYFTRSVKEDDIFVEYSFVSEKTTSGSWTEAKKLNNPFNTSLKNSISFVSIDGSYIIIKGIFEKGELMLNKRGFAFVEKTNNGWKTPQNINIEKYATLDRGLHNGMTVNARMDKIFFSFSEQPNDVNNDLYISFRQSNNSYSKPVKLETPLNTAGNEFSPFLASDEMTLYFASDRAGGMGLTDIWMSRRLDDTWLKWSEPKNLGSPVNSEAKEGYYSIDATSQFAFMVSEKNALGKADIVKVQLTKQQQAGPVALVFGKAIDNKTNKPVDAQIFYELLKDDTKVGSVFTNPSTGYYKIILPFGEKYVVLPKAKGYLSESMSLDLTAVVGYKEMEKDLNLIPIEVGQTIKINNIFFKYNSQELATESFAELNRLYDELIENPAMEIEIEGHTDNVGSADYNLKLSNDRAEAVKKYLLDKGLTNNRLTKKGFGEQYPIAVNDTDEGRAMNRRVVFTILKK
jgi:OmpA-OmpF porin, OOP family